MLGRLTLYKEYKGSLPSRIKVNDGNFLDLGRWSDYIKTKMIAFKATQMETHELNATRYQILLEIGLGHPPPVKREKRPRNSDGVLVGMKC
jgi:hypothetical protein